MIASRRAPLVAGTPCGDWVGSHAGTHQGAPCVWLAVVDGLGHGAPAAQAADLAAAHLQAAWRSPALAPEPAALLRALSPVLRDSRGAAAGLVCLHRGELRHAGIGNTRCLVWHAGRQRHLPSNYGIVGEASGSEPTETRLPLADGDWVVLFSDGLDEALRLDLLGLVPPPSPERLCEALMARWRDPRDDAAVLAARWMGTEG